MKTIKEIIKNYDKYKTPIEDRLGKRFCQFLNDEQMKKLGFEYNLEEGQERPPVIPFTEENVLKGRWTQRDICRSYAQCVSRLVCYYRKRPR